MEYEAKMSSMEEMWQNQMSSLQLSLVVAKRSLATDDSFLLMPMKDRDSVNGHFGVGKLHQRHKQQLLPVDDEELDWNDATSNGTRSPDQYTYKYLLTGPEFSISRGDAEAAQSVVNHLVREYDRYSMTMLVSL